MIDLENPTARDIKRNLKALVKHHESKAAAAKVCKTSPGTFSNWLKGSMPRGGGLKAINKASEKMDKENEKGDPTPKGPKKKGDNGTTNADTQTTLISMVRALATNGEDDSPTVHSILARIERNQERLIKNQVLIANAVGASLAKV